MTPATTPPPSAERIDLQAAWDAIDSLPAIEFSDEEAAALTKALTPPQGRPSREEVYEAIHKARHVPGGLPYRTLAEDGPRDREYAKRLGDAVLALFPASPQPATADAGDAGEVERLRAALREIIKGEGAYSRDQLEHAANTIDSMKEIARNALAATADAEVQP